MKPREYFVYAKDGHLEVYPSEFPKPYDESGVHVREVMPKPDHEFLSNCIDSLRNTLIKDEDYRRSWQANIAMAFKDEWQRSADNGGLPCKPEHIHEIANKAATYFLSLLCTGGEGKTFRMLPNLYEPISFKALNDDFETGSQPGLQEKK